MSEENGQHPGDTPEPISINRRRRSVPVVVEDGEGQARNWSLRQMTAHERDVWQDAQRHRFVMKRGQLDQVKSMIGYQTSLIAKCLYGDDDKLVPEKEIIQLPPDAIDALFEACEKLNLVGGHAAGVKKAQEDAKKN